MVDSVISRLERTPASTVGMILSRSGFSRSAITQARAKAPQRALLLFDGEDLDKVFHSPDYLRRLIGLKQRRILTHGYAATGRLESSTKSERKIIKTVQQHEFFWSEDRQREYVSMSGGDYSKVVFVQDLVDLDWTTSEGTAVALDLAMNLHTLHDLLDLFGKLSALGWISAMGRWTLYQQENNWRGMGIDPLLRALEIPAVRYKAVRVAHHTEALAYYDACPGGFFTLTADIDFNARSHSYGQVAHCSISIILTGIPLDPAPIQHLYEAAGIDAPAYFRPLGRPSLERGFVADGEAEPLQVTELLVGEYLDDARDPLWVEGIVAVNPFARSTEKDRVELPKGWPAILANNTSIICSLRDFHPVNRPPDLYRLRGWELAWTSDACAVKFLADW